MFEAMVLDLQTGAHFGSVYGTVQVPDQMKPEPHAAEHRGGLARRGYTPIKREAPGHGPMSGSFYPILAAASVRGSWGGPTR